MVLTSDACRLLSLPDSLNRVPEAVAALIDHPQNAKCATSASQLADSLAALQQRGAAREHIERVAGVVACNAFAVVAGPKLSKYGSALYRLAPMLNHSCAPNCCIWFTERGAASVRVIRHVEAGEELTITYCRCLASYTQGAAVADLFGMVGSPWQAFLPRQLELANRFYFSCQCERCISECHKVICFSLRGLCLTTSHQSLNHSLFSPIRKHDSLSNRYAVAL